MGIVTKKVQSAPHTIIDGITYRRCGEGRKIHRANSHDCGKLRRVYDGPGDLKSEYLDNAAYTDGHAVSCIYCIEDGRQARTAAVPVEKTPRARRETALAFDKSNQVKIRGVGNVTIGWHGNAEYWPVKPLKRLLNTAWPHLSKAIKSHELLGSVVTYFVTTGSDGKQYEMLCLPWSHWHTFWLKFGNADTLEVQQDAQRVLERAFGNTAEQVQQQTARARSGAIPLLDLETYRKNRHRFKALDEADNQIDQARQEATGALIKAQAERMAADHLIAEAKERQRAAQQAEQDAQQRIDEATRQQATIEAELNKLFGQDAEWFYDFGRESDVTPMYVSGKFGETGNIQAKRKLLKSGDTRGDFRLKRQCDSAEGVETHTRRYLAAFGTIRGKDGYENVPRERYDRLIAALQEHEYIELEWFISWVDHELAKG